MKAMKMLLGALLALMVLGGIGMAQTTTQVNADVAKYLKLTVPGEINGWHLTVGPNTQPGSGLSVDTNAAWEIDAKSALDLPELSNNYYGTFWSQTAYTANIGAMAGTPAAGPGFLANVLHLDAGTDFPLSDNNHVLRTGTSVGLTPVSFAMNQQVVSSDPAENDYRIVIEFTASNII